MSNYLLGFPDKKERNDFLIAIVVILFFISLFGFYLGRGDGPKLDTNIVPTAEVIAEDLDSDMDGILDADDDCPNLKGVASNKGCPIDTDNDGIYDTADRCPQLAGVSENDGCPRDSDQDGVYDDDDACPNIPFNSETGCPPDSDGDGVFDHLDKCPKEKGSKKYKGCPFSKEETALIRDIQSSVEFETGRAVLTNASLAKLDELAIILKKYPNIKMKVEGHTDSSGDAQKNLNLSQGRATACKQYLVEQGISSSRLKAKGFGSSKPIASNSTNEGKAKNRRVEFKSY